MSVRIIGTSFLLITLLETQLLLWRRFLLLVKIDDVLKVLLLQKLFIHFIRYLFIKVISRVLNSV